MKDNVLDYLFFSDDRIYSQVECSEQYSMHHKNQCEIAEKLRQELTAEQCKLLDQYDNCQLDMECETMKTYFIAGFKMGMKIAKECFNDK